MAKKSKTKAAKKPAKSVKGKAKKTGAKKSSPAKQKVNAHAKKNKSKVAKKFQKKSVNSKVIKVASSPKSKKASKTVNKTKVTKPVISKAKAEIKKLPETNKTLKPTAPVKEKKTTSVNGNGNGLNLRYSDKDLVEFKGIILDKLSEAKRDLDLLRSSMSHLDDHGTDDTSPTFKLMEDGSDVLTKEETAQLASRQQKFIKHLEDALMRIENKSYGICRVTGTLIPKERLRVVPHATLSIEAKQKQF